MPLDWDDPEGERIVFFVKRRLAKVQPARAQLWFLQGGPGNSVVPFEASIPKYVAGDPTVDLYMPEHRGVGKSTRLACPEAEKTESAGGVITMYEELPACLPVLEADGSLAGMVSIGDLVKARIAEAEMEATELRHYVSTAG